MRYTITFRQDDFDELKKDLFKDTPLERAACCPVPRCSSVEGTVIPRWNPWDHDWQGPIRGI